MSDEVDAVCRVVLEKAYQTSPQTDWQPQTIVDYAGQRLALSTMRAQLEEQVSRTTPALWRAPYRWATTGKWTKLQRADAFVLREAILSALAEYRKVVLPDTIKAAYVSPPWSEDIGVWLRAVTVEVWHEVGCSEWLDSTAQEEFEIQERDFASRYPYV